MNFTKDQQSVINIRNKNVLVSAAAGSGKTAVLVERIIRMISDEEKPADIDRLLVLTFTNLAAGEMRERIGLAIGKKLECNPENDHLQRQMTLLHNAQITTIDSFCLFILRNHFHVIGLDPGFRVADEGELKLLRKDVLSELLEERYELKDNEFLDCVEYFTSGSNDSVIEDHIEKIYSTAMSFPWPEDWLSERINDYKVNTAEELLNSEWMKYLLVYTENIIAGCISELKKAIKICEEPDGPYMYGGLLDNELHMLFNLTKCNGSEEHKNTFADYVSYWEKLSFGRLSPKKDDSVSNEKREQVKNIRKMVKDAITGIGETYYKLNTEKIIERMAVIKPAVMTLIDLVSDYKSRFDKAKREKNIVDFNDMEHFALDILWEKSKEGIKPSVVARELKSHFHTVMTDEYQDSNQVQELLLESISGEDEGRNNRFMVGDVKQSIYKFRLARPEIFMEKYDCYPLLSDTCERIDLNQNFRSRALVLDGVNFIFKNIMQKPLGGIEYDSRAALYPGAEYPDNGQDSRTELLLLDLNEEAEDEALSNEFLTDSKKELEARMVARRIKEMTGSFRIKDQESGLLKPLNYRDIVILLRTAKEWDEIFKRVLNEEGIPAITTARTGYFKAAEIQTILHLINIINNPHQDIPLFGVMKSFFGDFTDEEIVVIKTRSNGKGGLYDKVMNFTDDNNNDKQLIEKINKFTSFIEEYRQKSVYTPIADLLKDLIIGSGYYHYIAVHTDGEQRLANLEMLLKKAVSFAETSYYGLFHFVRYIEQLEKYDVDYGEANILDEQADVVRILSIHKSKGLEFPVCFVCGLSKQINLRDASGQMCLDIDLGLGVDDINPELRVRRKSLRKSVIGQKIKLDSLGEELRILYVAMTRAKEKLFLTGIPKKLPAPDTVITCRPSFLQLTNTGNFLDLLMPLIMSEGAAEIFTSRIFTVSDLAMETLNDMIDLNLQRDKLLAMIKPDKNGDLLILNKNDGSSESMKEKVTEVSERFARPYPHENLSNLYAKTTVSELKKLSMAGKVIDAEEMNNSGIINLFEEPEIIPYIPKFMREDTQDSGISSGPARGSAYHKVMEVIDFKNLSSNIENQINDAIENGRLPAEYKDAVPITKITAFFASPLAARMSAAANAGQLYREQPFVIGISADRLNPDFPPGETILIQGIIDSYFVEEDGLVILDYKSDAVKSKEELITRYQKQLNYYQEALSQLTGKPVKEKIIYSFALNKAINI